jgi:DNA-binding NtrC family response regulator
MMVGSLCRTPSDVTFWHFRSRMPYRVPEPPPESSEKRRSGRDRRVGGDRRARLVPRLSVVEISDAFREFWSDVGLDLGVPIEVRGALDGITPGPETIAVIVAAGGAEQDAIRWLESHRFAAGLPVLVVATDGARRTATQVVARGASDYFALPEDLEVLRNTLVAAVKACQARVAAGTGGNSAFAGIVGSSPAIKDVLDRASRLLPHPNAGALIVGETGTGKELLARAIHEGGPRRVAPFVAINCSALPEHLIESELFGHERGAFTDAHAPKPGLFEVADGGTLFLDEIGEVPLGLQSKLLRAIETREIRRVGATKHRLVDVRILAATNEHLPNRVRDGSFREDLFFRLSTVVLKMPPLRERGDDILLIAEALLERYAREHGLPVPILTPDVRYRLTLHPWPGNVRELKNALERALLLSPSGELSADELLPQENLQMEASGPIPFPAPLQEITTAAAHATLKLCGGNRSESARRLGISTRRLRRLLSGVDDFGPEAGKNVENGEGTGSS